MSQPASPSVAPSTSTAADRSSAFHAVEGPGEAVNGGKLLIAAYAFVWVVVLVLIVRTYRKQSQTAEDLDRLETALKRPKP